MPSTINSDDLSLEKLFNGFYVIPPYQREYVWGEKEVTEFIEDIYEEYNLVKTGKGAEYFIGSIIVRRKKEEEPYEVIDGQQRITTAYLLLCAVRDHVIEISPETPLNALKNKIASFSSEPTSLNNFIPRVELQYEESREIVKKIALNEDFKSVSGSLSVDRIKSAYQLLRQFIEREFNKDPNKIAELKMFYAYFIKNVKLIRVKTASITHALKIYGTLNHRGLPLDEMDLLKNFIFGYAQPKEYQVIKTTWKTLVDLLFNSKESPRRFLRYFILSTYDLDDFITEAEIYDWFVANASLCGYEKNPLEFINQLVNAAIAYTRFLEGKNKDGSVNQYLVNCRYLSANARQHLLLLLAGQNLAIDHFNELCRVVESVLFISIVIAPRTKTFDKLLLKWAKLIQKVTDINELTEIINNEINPSKQRLLNRFETVFKNLSKTSIQDYQLRYILAKLTQYIDQQAWGNTGGIDHILNYIFRLEIDYIFPLQPTKEMISKFGKPDQIEEYTQKLGNLTLIEKSLYQEIANASFPDKKKAYTKSKFLLTRTIAEPVEVSENSLLNLAVRDLQSFNSWNSNSIDDRQIMLTELAKKVWDML